MAKPYTPMSPKALAVVMRSAANVIAEGAESMRQSCEGGTPARNWACDDCHAMRADGRCQGAVLYERDMAIVGLLRAEVLVRVRKHSSKGGENG